MTTDVKIEAPEAKKSLGAEAMEWVKTIAGAAVVYLVVTTAAFANYSIPSESMVPTLEVGDRVVVSKIAYGYSRHSLPLNIGFLLPAASHRLFEHMPDRGDVVVFIHPNEGKVMIKRLIGLPGDVIEVRDGFLSINGQRAELTQGVEETREAYRNGAENVVRYEETLPNGVQHPIHIFPTGGLYDDFGPYTVPEGRLFFMGDNRDNSADSRASMGTVPLENLIGRAETVYWAGRNCSRDAGITCPQPRWLKPLHD